MLGIGSKDPTTLTLVTRASVDLVADRDREAALGQTAILRAAFKLIDWVKWSTDNGIDTSRFYRLADQKVWTFVTEPEHELVDPAEIHQKLKQKYPDGFPESWKRSEEAVPTLEGFRRYATFWFHSVYDSTKGPRLAIHREELPEDFPDNEYDAFIQVAQILTAHSSSDTPVPSSRRLSFSTPVPGIGDRPRPSRLSSARESVPPPLREPIVAPRMVETEFPEKIKSENLLAFNGIPGKVLSLDITVEDLCSEHDYPAYYGGTVLGIPKTGYRYVAPGTAGSAANYHFGTRVCSSITGKFIDNARMWWEDYRKHGGPKPNCWKKSELHPEGSTKPDSVKEISLYEILKKEFPEENDEVEAGMELKRYKWNPSHKDAPPFATFKTYSQSLALRAGNDRWMLRMPHIVQCIEPVSLRDAVRLYDEEDRFWFECRITVNTWLSKHPVSAVTARCGNCNGSHDTKDCRKGAAKSYSKPSMPSRGDAACDWCNKKGHYKSECLRLKGQISRGEIAPEERNRRGGPESRSAPSTMPAPRSYLPRAGRPSAPAGPSKQFSCRNCGGVGHGISVCPSRLNKTAMAAAATNMVDDQKQDNDDDSRQVTQYLMHPWIPMTDVLRSETRGSAIAREEGVDELFSTVIAGNAVEFPVFNNIVTPVDAVEVIENVVGKVAKPIVKVSDAIDMSAFGPTSGECPTGPVWTISSTLRGQDMLTIFDTGAVKAAIPISTATGSRSTWTENLPHQLCFIKSDGSRYTPAGYCPSFKFRFGTFEYDIEAYVVDNAPFQLLLGTEFLWATGADLFLRPYEEE
ncbi:hypothetical protein EDC01DRAFT_627527 [Geopyxis carbonaria]|nr:hypothetical protein EDC01DRAFT_627527 [Geopyxis carbonaria]